MKDALPPLSFQGKRLKTAHNVQHLESSPTELIVSYLTKSNLFRLLYNTRAQCPVQHLLQILYGQDKTGERDIRITNESNTMILVWMVLTLTGLVFSYRNPNCLRTSPLVIVIRRGWRATEYASPSQFVENLKRLDGNTKTIHGVFLIDLNSPYVDVGECSSNTTHHTLQPERNV